MASFLQVDDSRFRPWTVDWGDPVPRGCVALDLRVLRSATLPDFD